MVSAVTLRELAPLDNLEDLLRGLFQRYEPQTLAGRLGTLSELVSPLSADTMPPMGDHIAERTPLVRNGLRGRITVNELTPLGVAGSLPTGGKWESKRAELFRGGGPEQFGSGHGFANFQTWPGRRVGPSLVGCGESCAGEESGEALLLATQSAPSRQPPRLPNKNKNKPKGSQGQKQEEGPKNFTAMLLGHVLYGKGRGKGKGSWKNKKRGNQGQNNNNNNNKRRRTGPPRGGPVGQDGQPKTCRHCGSKFHFAANCPDRVGSNKFAFPEGIRLEKKSKSAKENLRNFLARGFEYVKTALVERCTLGTVEKSIVVDSGASIHMSGDREHFDSVAEAKDVNLIVAGREVPEKGRYGVLRANQFGAQRAVYHPELRGCLLSVGQLKRESKTKTVFGDDGTPEDYLLRKKDGAVFPMTWDENLPTIRQNGFFIDSDLKQEMSDAVRPASRHSEYHYLTAAQSKALRQHRQRAHFYDPSVKVSCPDCAVMV